MNKIIRKTHPIIKIINLTIIDLPRPSNISIWWNFGSLLGLCLIIQTISGLFLAIHYTSDISTAFNSIIHIIQDVNNGWILRILHANGASLIFVCVYIHVSRRIYYGSYLYTFTWMSGMLILILIIATAFIGYVLPWGQISFWGATVITNLFSAIPYLGNSLVQWIWGGFAIDNATLNRFFTFHFILPFLIIAIAIIHIIFLHQTGSNNPLGVNRNIDKIPFHPYFRIKDILGFLIILFLLITSTIIIPFILRDPDNFIIANPLVTPEHIQPEWYFLFAYAILRSIPNKLGGVIGLLLSINIIIIIPFYHKRKFRGLEFYPLSQIIFWTIIASIFILSWIGAQPVDAPYIKIGQLTSIIYFNYYIITPVVSQAWDITIK